METVYAVVLMGGRWTVAIIPVRDLTDRLSLGSCAKYDTESRALLESIAKFQNKLEDLRK